MKRKYNFSPGPAVLPEKVLEKVAKELSCYPNLGYSILETSHRSKIFEQILEATKSKILKYLNLKSNYSVLLLQGGASTEFYRIPMNLLNKEKTADFIETDVWPKKAFKEAKFFGNPRLAGSSGDRDYKYIPSDDQLEINAKSEYLYLCSNNTIYGTQFQNYPKSPIPLVGDFTSDIFSREIDMSNFGIIFAGSQKNLAPAGLTVVIIRDDILERCNEEIPSMCSYKNLVKTNSLFNTAPVFPIYFLNYVLDWIEEEGGIIEIEKRNRYKSQLIYEKIDQYEIYTGYAELQDRSIMNITFNLANQKLLEDFLKGAEMSDLTALKGHRDAGGIRASMYNAFPVAGAEKLAKYMDDFAKKN